MELSVSAIIYLQFVNKTCFQELYIFFSVKIFSKSVKKFFKISVLYLIICVSSYIEK